MTTRTRLPDLLALYLGVALAAWLLVRVLYGSLPPVPLLAGAGLLLLAATEVGLAVVLRGRIQRRPGARLLDPLAAARAVALAKASSSAGVLVAGAWTGLLVHLVGNGELAAAAQDRPGTVLGLVSALLLVVAALVLEHSLRTPDGPPRRPD